MPPIRSRAAALLAAAALTAGAHAQSAGPAVFVANNGNLEGSVSSMAINPDGTLALVDRVITGTRASLSLPCPGCNTYAIDLSPDGRHLATTHATGDNGEEVNIYRVHEDATLTVVETILLDPGGLDIAWVRDDLLAAANTTFGPGNQLRLYRFDDTASTLTLTDTEPAGEFLTSMSVHPSGDWVAVNDSFGFTVRIFGIDGDDATLATTAPIPVYGVALGFAPDGSTLYAAGGISAGGNAFSGEAFNDASGALAPLPGSAFTSPGDSPKGFAFSASGDRLFVSHGTDATIQVFDRDPSTGVPAFAGQAHDVGSQGTLQGMAVLADAPGNPGADTLFAIDSSTAFDGAAGVVVLDVDPGTGALAPRPGSPFDTGGITPNDVAVWGGTACPADANGDGMVNILDVVAFINLWNAQGPGADANNDGEINILDVVAFVGTWNAGCS